MNAILDAALVPNSLVEAFQNRGFLYGDGVFETLMVRNGSLFFAEDHFFRFSLGLQVLQLQPEFDYSLKNMLDQTEQLLDIKKLQNARVKWYAWRKNGGLYTPESEICHILVTAEASSQPIFEVDNIVLSESARVCKSATSDFKTLSSLPYVMAGLEAKSKKLKDILICDAFGNLAESTSSNLFCIKGAAFQTPDLSGGGIPGIMRKQIQKYCAHENLEFNSSVMTIEHLLEADLVFLCNVTGFRAVRRFENQPLNCKKEAYAHLLRLSNDLKVPLPPAL